MERKVRYELEGPVAIITINRPDVHNCIDGETAKGLGLAWKKFQEDDLAKVAILTGAGDTSFSSGADLKALDTLGPVEQFDVNFAYNGDGYLGFTRLNSVLKPTIAAINGYCFAGGLEMACWCDIRIASDKAEFGCLERRWNVPLVDGGTQRLPRILGWGRGMDLILTGRKIDAKHAYDWGLVTEVVPHDQLMTRCKELANQMANYPQGSLISDKQAAIRGWDLPLDEALRVECQLGMPHVKSDETEDGLERFKSRVRT
ncbi:enoyl-CoA hydratase-related protein [Alkalihalobacterium elongatum]|uniref:enoyl-CoA hydratase-related protein n=1 Tax=Alkalihalobacterium elongatum TaxID=2675466 RepID=UPI001C1F83BF|nr:enoyl-CoA hydratase-related protein [Alkalihalobacterium elongatum]